MGVSFDTPTENEDWAVAEGFQFELWSDESRAMALHYGAASSASATFANRISFLLDENGEVLLEYPVVITGTHPSEILSDCQAIFGP